MLYNILKEVHVFWPNIDFWQDSACWDTGVTQNYGYLDFGLLRLNKLELSWGSVQAETVILQIQI